jgi:hypothetical protein
MNQTRTLAFEPSFLNMLRGLLVPSNTPKVVTLIPLILIEAGGRRGLTAFLFLSDPAFLRIKATP